MVNRSGCQFLYLFFIIHDAAERKVASIKFASVNEEPETKNKVKTAFVASDPKIFMKE